MFQKFLVMKKMYGWERGISQFSVTFSFPIVSKNFVCNSSIFVKVWGTEKELCMRRRSRCHDFRLDFCVSQYRKISVEAFVASENFWQRIFIRNAIGDISFFRWIIFVSQYRKIWLGTLRSFWKVLVAKSLYGWEKGMSGFFHRNLLYHGTEVFHWNIFGDSENFCYGKNYMDKTGVTQFASNFLVSQSRIVLWGSPQSFWKFGVSKNFYG